MTRVNNCPFVLSNNANFSIKASVNRKVPLRPQAKFPFTSFQLLNISKDM